MTDRPAADPHSPVSPESTGGAGTVFEYRVAALILVKLLSGHHVLGLPEPPAAIGLQRRAAGNTVDDVIVHAEPVPDGYRIDWQVKRTAHPRPSDEGFKGTVEQFIAAIEDEPDAVAEGRLRVGLIASKPQKQLTELKKLTQLAREHDTPSSMFTLLQKGVTDEDVRVRYDLVSQTVAALLGENAEDVDQMVHRLLAALQVWIVDVGPEGRDTLDALDTLGELTPPADPHAILEALADIAETAGPQGGRLTAPMVRRKLERRGIALSAAAGHRAALAVLRSSTNRLLDAISTTLRGEFHLPRECLREELRTAIASGLPVLVRGPAGAGKSALARAAVADMRDEAEVVAVDLAGRTGHTVADLNAELGADLGRTLPHAPTTRQRVLLIDGAEHALTDHGRLLSAVLQAVPWPSSEDPPWTVVVTARDEAADLIREHVAAAGAEPTTVNVTGLADDEIDGILARFPELQRLDRHPRSRRLLTRLYIVDLLLRAQGPAPGSAMGEEDVLDHIWERLVRRSEQSAPGSGNPNERARACAQAAEAIIKNGSVGRLPDAEGDALSGLCSDDILARTGRTRFRFAHDVLADHAVAHRLLDDDRDDLLMRADDPRRLLRAVRLSAQRRLADLADTPEDVRAAWASEVATCRRLAQVDGQRWDDVPYEALLAAGEPGPLLGALAPLLLERDGEGLARLVDVTTRYAAVNERDHTTGDLLLDVVLAAPVVMFASSIADRVPERWIARILELLHRWLRSVATSGETVDTYGLDPRRLADAVLAWVGDDEWSGRVKPAAGALALLAGHLPERAIRFLTEQIRRHDLGRVVDDPVIAEAVAKQKPDVLLLLAGLYYLDLPLAVGAEIPTPATEPGSRSPRRLGTLPSRLEEEGVRSHFPEFFHLRGGLAGPDCGPFASLLEASPEHGLHLIGALVDEATRARTRLLGVNSAEPTSLRLTLLDGTQREYVGTGEAWSWYRRLSSGPYPATSALAALRRWAVEQAGERPGEVAHQILMLGDSVAFPAVALSVLISFIEDVDRELDPFLEHPLVWDLETARTVGGQALGLPDPHPDTLQRTLDQIATYLVLRGGAERREELKRVGERLLDRSRNESGNNDPEMLVAQKRASTLDIDTYAFERGQDDQVYVTVEPGEEVREGLARSGGEAARLSLGLASATFACVKIRDGEERDSDPVELWETIEQLIERLDELGSLDSAVSPPGDARAAAAAASVVVAARSGAEVGVDRLRKAVGVLVGAAQRSAAEDPTGWRDTRRLAWDQGEDRSAASSLPLIAARPETFDRAGIDTNAVEDAILALAGSLYEETRKRLVSALCETITHPGHREEATHAVAIASAEELIASSGLGEWTEHGTRPRTRIEGPLEDALGTDEVAVSLPAVADAVPLLVRLESLECEHGGRAATLLDALVNHDLRMWPTDYGRRGYDASEWRTVLDGHVATRVLQGETGLLDRYLDAFRGVDEDLRGLLEALPARATTAQLGSTLLELWPQLLDRLLPDRRDLSGSERPYRRDVEELDRALFPKRPEGVDWPVEAHVRVLVRTAMSFAGQPHVVDRLIETGSPYGLTLAPDGAKLVLRVLGDTIERILRDSHYTVPWLRFALFGGPDWPRDVRGALRDLVDRLAAAGDPDAVQLQRDLEV